MNAILALAKKDLKLLFRNKGHVFFSFVWPVLMALFFGLIFGGDDGQGTIPVAVVDLDRTAGSAALVARLRATAGLEISIHPQEEAERLVRAGKRTAAVIVPAGYGDADERLFAGETRRLEIAADPSRKAEAAMLEGLLTRAAMTSLQEQLTDPARGLRSVDRALDDLRAAPPGEAGAAGEDRAATERFLGELRAYLRTRPADADAGRRDAAGPDGGGWSPVAIELRALSADGAGPRSAFEFTFPQGVLWGVIGCSLGFAVTLVVERTHGTLTRLRSSPLSRTHVLLGKALACFVAILAVEAMLFALGRIFFGVRPSSPVLLAVAALSLAVCFVGIMMAASVLGRTEQTVGGLAWAIMLPMAMLGGGMVPLFVMPPWMQAAGNVSPVKWGILALEGAIWRGFGPREMLLPCAVLLAAGAAGFAIGALRFRDAE